MAVTAQNLSDIFRAEVDDTVTPYLWSDIEVLGYIDEAQKAFARRTELFYDSVTPAITSIAIVAGAGTVALDPRILRIRRAKLASQTKALVLTNLAELDASWNWESATGTPTVLVQDLSVNTGQLIPSPQAADTLNLWVYRDPINVIAALTDVLEVADPLDMRLGLLTYMKSIAYGKNDSDIHNEVLAKMATVAFNAYVDRKSTRLNSSHTDISRMPSSA